MLAAIWKKNTRGWLQLICSPAQNALLPQMNTLALAGCCKGTSPPSSAMKFMPASANKF
jgi:hypothetical protein